MSRRKRLPTFLRQAEADALLSLAAADVEQAKTPKQAARARRDCVIIKVGLFCGLRVSEICNLEVPDIDLAGKMLLVRQGKGNKDRAVPLAEKLLPDLAAWIGERKTGYLFPAPSGKRLSTRTLQDRIPELAKRAGLVRRISPHKLRHSFCTRLVENGIDIVAIKELAGHSSIQTTQIYLHTTPERLRGAVDKL